MQHAAASWSTQLCEALAWKAGAICVEIDLYPTPHACIRTSNSAKLITLEADSAADLVADLKDRLFSSPMGEMDRRSGYIELNGSPFILNVCPQIGGEIIVLHPTDSARHLRSILTRDDQQRGVQKSDSVPSDRHAHQSPLTAVRQLWARLLRRQGA